MNNVINTHEAKTHLSKILDDVGKGKEFIIGKAGIPIAKLIPFKPSHQERKGRQLKGKIKIGKNFDKLPKEFLNYFT